MNDPRIAAIRRHPLIGESRMPFLLMCHDDAEIIEMLDADAANSIDQAIAWAIDHQDFRLEQALNCRFGNDDDPQLLQYQEFEAERKQYE